jgi:threonine/homoserine/homoserine lactone efflux protein|tara:strand:+ start:598 stop:1215 length:618 start_codon:yes stop_codon:yes gene_type:complete
VSIFLTVALLHFFAVASPGPDFVLVSQQSFRYGRTVAIWTSGGIALGILFHVAISLTGLSLLLQNQPDLFWYLKLAASLYIGYLGFVSLISRESVNLQKISTEKGDRYLKSISTGFFINVLNPKAFIFFITVFTLVINEDTGLFIKGLLGIYMSLATFIWFTFVSILLTNQIATERFKIAIPWLEKITGLFLIVLAVQIILIESF